MKLPMFSITQISAAARLAGLCLFVSAAFFICSAQTPSRDPREASPGTGPQLGQSIVKGRTVFEDTGQAVPRVRVQLLAVRTLAAAATRGPMIAFTSITNEQGEFRFNGIPAGEYYAVAQVDPRETGAQSSANPTPTGDATADAARVEQFKQAATKVLVDGRNSVEIELRVPNPHFSVLSGYVIKASGDLAVRARVTCFSTAKDGGRGFSLSAATDEKGAFRIERVPPGEYLLSADPPGDQPVARASVTPSLIPTYYPSTADAASAVPIIVAPDGETPGINITLIERGAHRVSGTVTMHVSGEPIPYAVVQLSPRSGPNRSSTTGGGDAQIPQIQPADENGRWSFSNIPDGAYVISVQARQTAPPRNSSAAATTAGQSRNPTPKFSAKRQEITVAGADLPDVTIEVSGGGRISGSVVVEGDKPLPANIAIMAGAKETGQPPASTTVQADGSFTLSGVPEGEVLIVPQLRPPDTFYVKAIQANGVDLLREPPHIVDGAEIKNVKVVISSAVAVLTGHVFAAQGKTPLSRVAIFLIPIDPEQRRLQTSRFTGTSKPDGTFLIGAAPGDYIVVAWRPGDPSPLDPEAQAANKLRITLRAGERRSLDLEK